MAVISHVWERDVINPGGDVICRESDLLYVVVVVSYSGCHVIFNGYDVVNYSGCDLRNTVGAISSIQWR